MAKPLQVWQHRNFLFSHGKLWAATKKWIMVSASPGVCRPRGNHQVWGRPTLTWACALRWTPHQTRRRRGALLSLPFSPLPAAETPPTKTDLVGRESRGALLKCWGILTEGGARGHALRKCWTWLCSRAGAFSAWKPDSESRDTSAASQHSLAHLVTTFFVFFNNEKWFSGEVLCLVLGHGCAGGPCVPTWGRTGGRGSLAGLCTGTGSLRDRSECCWRVTPEPHQNAKPQCGPKHVLPSQLGVKLYPCMRARGWGFRPRVKWLWADVEGLGSIRSN